MDEIFLAKGLFVLAVLVAATFDLVSYRIPNAIVVGLLILFFGLAALDYPSVDWVDHLLAGVGLFAAGLVFYALGQMGAGDVKLLGAIALWSGSRALLPVIFWISVCGLAVLLTVLLLRILALRLRAGSGPRKLPRILTWGEGIPYGVPISMGTLIALPAFPVWSWNG